MVATTLAVAMNGLEGALVVVEADVGQSLPGFSIIGLPDTALADARERVRAAALNDGCPLPSRKMTVNLSPAALPKQGSGFDLSIAVAILAASGTIDSHRVARVVHLGELSLDGRLRPLRGVLPAVLAGVGAGCTRFFVPAANASEASLVPGAEITPVVSLRHAALLHGAELEPEERDPLPLPEEPPGASPAPELELADVIGQEEATEALVVAAAGGHHLMMVGPPGAGKSMLAARLPGILPDLEPDAALRVAAIRSLGGYGPRDTISVRPPFEAPHHTVSATALVGGGTRGIRPGSIARASEGVLFLDEAPEFGTSVVDALRQPLENGQITVHRAHAQATFPANFQLVLAANPCPCGYALTVGGNCSCAPSVQRRYLARLSGPLLDRVDIRVRVQPVAVSDLRLASSASQTSTVQARSRVVAARRRARERLHGTPWDTNGRVAGPWLRNGPHTLSKALTVDLDRAVERGALSLRGYDRVLRIAWTLADLDGASSPTGSHVGSAMALRGSM